jgi:hypothetical protein
MDPTTYVRGPNRALSKNDDNDYEDIVFNDQGASYLGYQGTAF